MNTTRIYDMIARDIVLNKPLKAFRNVSEASKVVREIVRVYKHEVFLQKTADNIFDLKHK